MKSLELQIMDSCKHFNGIQHEMCFRKVPYEQFRKTGGALSLPCFQDELNGAGCDKAEWWTLQEAEKQAEESRQAVEKYISAIAEGKCPQCDKRVLHKQVGHCVYGSCGHRLYQGTVSPEFAQG